MTSKEVVEDGYSFDRISAYRIAGGLVAGALVAAPAMAVTFDLNATIGPLLDGVAAMIPSMINLMVAAVPLVVIGSIIGALLNWFPDLFKFGKA